MRLVFLTLMISFFIGCATFQPEKFERQALEEMLLDVNRNEISFQEVIGKKEHQKKLIQIYASYCPISQESFKSVESFQNKNTNIDYVFLSVDHSYYDWKRGLEALKIKGRHYYIQEKGKGSLGQFLKLKTIPRFLIVDEEGSIILYKAPKLTETVQQKIQ